MVHRWLALWRREADKARARRAHLRVQLLEDRTLLSQGLVIVPSPQINNSQLSSTAAIADNDMWAIGVIFSPTSTQPFAEHFNGASWSVVPTPQINGSLGGIAGVASNDVWAVGGPTYVDNTANAFIEHWNGTTWSIFPSPKLQKGAVLSAVTAISASDVWAVGDVNPAREGLLVEHWDGTSWSVVSSPAFTGAGPSIGVSADAGNDVWIADGPIFLHFDGTSWSQLPGSPKPLINAGPVTAISPTNVWAAGIGSTSRNGFPRGLIEHWDGTSWNVVGSPIARTNTSSGLDGIAAVSANDVWAVGTTEVAENWNGTSWNVVSTPSGVRALTGLSALPDGTVVAVDGDTIVSNVAPGSATASAVNAPKRTDFLAASSAEPNRAARPATSAGTTTTGPMRTEGASPQAAASDLFVASSGSAGTSDAGMGPRREAARHKDVRLPAWETLPPWIGLDSFAFEAWMG
jgi:hypothetical protein